VKIIVYDDNPDYGGHQIMACHGIESLAKDSSLEIVFMFNPRNEKLADRLAETPTLQLLEAPCSTRKLQGLLNRISKKLIAALSQKFQNLEADLVLCIQGEIEDSSHAVLAARKACIKCISYIAIPHPMRLMGAKLGGLRDRINQYLLNQPDGYITISASMKKLLIERGTTVPIDIVRNGIPLSGTPRLTPRVSRPTTLGMLGRIEFNQKQQNFMVRTFCAFPEKFNNCHLIIRGDGPDEGKLRQLIAECPRRNDITLLPWQNDTESFYASIDFLMLPSRFEGIPLVMLEALAHGIPVIGSRRDGMQDILPDNWTFATENAGDLARTFSHVRGSWKNDVDTLRMKVETEMSLETFKDNFYRSIIKT
jgi:glycosyltransferase involved in cell wall biosynthesis